MVASSKKENFPKLGQPNIRYICFSLIGGFLHFGMVIPIHVLVLVRADELQNAGVYLLAGPDLVRVCFLRLLNN